MGRRLSSAVSGATAISFCSIFTVDAPNAIRGCGEDFVTDAAILPTLENVFLTVTDHSIRD